AVPCKLILALALSGALTAGACAPATTSGSGTASGNTRPSPIRISKAEINATSASSAYDVVSQLHPDWLRPPRSSLAGTLGATKTASTSVRAPLVLVYLDGVRLGGIDELRSLSASSVTSIEYADSSRVAMVVRDMGNVTPDAAIMVSTKQ
nr:hypothetical protein [Gemmatimonadota bacterium]